MRLERLYLTGFKSFSDRAEVAFHSGVTAIVGPNGCGKSNLADALTWVLGEQSAKSLRGETMEDLIFGGSEGRKPTGAAEVRVRLSGVPTPAALRSAFEDRTFRLRPSGNGNWHGEPTSGDREDDPIRTADPVTTPAAESNGAWRDETPDAVRDVEVTRRLYRSGESEYLIDGQSCRLRDIHELLMDTGLGAKAYSIIEQGKIGMILSSRPADRRSLIEEAAGITKYKSRRRAAELKLEAARQNLSRVGDIVFEIEKQRSSLKRQAGKARRYAGLREEMRRWEKLLFARKHRELVQIIEAVRARVNEARDRETAIAILFTTRERELDALRHQLGEAEATAIRARDAAHACEIDVSRREQQIALDTQQAAMLAAREAELQAESHRLEAQREPQQRLLETRREEARDAERTRDAAAALVRAALDEHLAAQDEIESREQVVERLRGESYSTLSRLTALQAAAETALVQRDRAAEMLARVEVEATDIRTEQARMRQRRAEADAALQAAHQRLDSIRAASAARGAELAEARFAHESRSRDVRAREQELAGMEARLRSLEELDAHRTGFSDAARMVLAGANGKVGQLGAVADFVEVEPRYERAVEAYLGDLLQHVLVEGADQAGAGLDLVRAADAGRCGFVIVSPGADAAVAVTSAEAPSDLSPISLDASALPLSRVMRVGEGHAALRSALGDALIVSTFREACELSARVPCAVVTVDGDVFRSAKVVSGGSKAESRGILATKREIKELREQSSSARRALDLVVADASALEHTIAQTGAAVAVLTHERHQQEKAIVSAEAQVSRATDEQSRLEARATLIAQERERSRDEIASLDARHLETSQSIALLAQQRAGSDASLTEAQHALAKARDRAEHASQGASEARATHATLVERAAASQIDVRRLEVLVEDLERRCLGSAQEAAQIRLTRERLITTVARGEDEARERRQQLEDLHRDLRVAEQEMSTLKSAADRDEAALREVRDAVDTARAHVAQLDIARATAEADLTHLAQQCVESVGMSIDDLEGDQPGELDPNSWRAEDPGEIDDEDGSPVEGAIAGAGDASLDAWPQTPEDALARLRNKVERLGPVNMMAIEQFSELEERHAFLSTQRQDLVDSIAQTAQAIQRIDETTHSRFREAFHAINGNFQGTFSTLFDGGRAGLTLLDENDPLEAGIDIVASPPGKRLQNVQLLSGGEKALTAIALMFAIFRYKPSPFCLLDEIDAPLDEANIGRFIQMLRGLMDRTQFIIITHNRKTMEIANRLYGVTMEEPGVSKLISLQLN